MARRPSQSAPRPHRRALGGSSAFWTRPITGGAAASSACREPPAGEDSSRFYSAFDVGRCSWGCVRQGRKAPSHPYPSTLTYLSTFLSPPLSSPPLLPYPPLPFLPPSFLFLFLLFGLLLLALCAFCCDFLSMTSGMSRPPLERHRRCNSRRRLSCRRQRRRLLASASAGRGSRPRGRMGCVRCCPRERSEATDLEWNFGVLSFEKVCVVPSSRRSPVQG